MTIAEQLRNEINIHQVMPWLKEDVTNSIRNCGYFSRICDKHINKITRKSSFPLKYYTPIEEWARKEGLKVYSTYNSYGVRSLKITL